LKAADRIGEKIQGPVLKKIADRFLYKNRDPILRSVSVSCPDPVFSSQAGLNQKSLIDLRKKIRERF
jgi:hypothetical protein